MRNSPLVFLQGLLFLALIPSVVMARPAGQAKPAAADRTRSSVETPVGAFRPSAAPVSPATPRKTPMTAADSYRALGLIPNPIREEAPPINDTCAGAIQIACGNISLSGNTIDANNDYALSDDTLGCTTYSSRGLDVVYKVTAQAGDSIWVRYKSTADGSIYIVTNCANVQTSCVAGADVTNANETENLSYRFPTAGTYYIILDSFGEGTFGPWTLVGQFISCGLFPPANDRCTTAEQLTCGIISKTGSTLTAFNDYNFQPGGACVNGSTAGGRDVAFRVDVNAADSIDVSLSSSANGVLYILSDCGDPSSSCVAGSNSGGAGATETIRYRFTFTGTYFLIVDFNANEEFSSNWGLTGNLVCGVGPPTNDNCSGATALRCGNFALSGSTAAAANDYSMPEGNSCTGFATFGPDVAYRLDVAPGDSLWADYRSTADGNIYLVKNCATPEDSCVIGVDNGIANDTEALRYKFTLRRTYYLILDSYDQGVSGTWTLNGNLICPLIAGVGDREPRVFGLGEFRPNPFVRSTTVRFTLSERGPATLRVFDLAGRVVRTLVDGDLPAGEHVSQWDARDAQGARVPAGMYFARLWSGERTALRKMLFVQ
jgi:hypothetical protein